MRYFLDSVVVYASSNPHAWFVFLQAMVSLAVVGVGWSVNQSHQLTLVATQRELDRQDRERQWLQDRQDKFDAEQLARCMVLIDQVVDAIGTFQAVNISEDDGRFFAEQGEVRSARNTISRFLLKNRPCLTPAVVELVGEMERFCNDFIYLLIQLNTSVEIRRSYVSDPNGWSARHMKLYEQYQSGKSVRWVEGMEKRIADLSKILAKTNRTIADV